MREMQNTALNTLRSMMSAKCTMGDDIIALLFSVGLVSPTAFPFRIAKSRQSSRSMLAALESRCLNTIQAQ